MLLNVVNLLRVRQWTKNLLVFLLPLSAGQVIGNNFSAPVLADSILLFFSLSFISSFNYAINDIIDIERDKIHFSKRHRPIASGALTVKNAFLVGFTSLAIGLIFAIQVNRNSFIYLSVFTLIQLSYSLFFKRIAGFDILLISILFVLRSTSAYTFDKVTISPWFVFTTFFSALLLATGKRLSEKMKLGANKSRPVLQYYSVEQLQSILTISGASIVFSYVSWVENSRRETEMVWGFVSVIPILTILIRIYPLIFSDKGEKPETAVLSDKIILLSGAVWIFFYLKSKGFL
jgi:decaprenyl-phosphate phosphoribosyltransferase